MVIETVRRQLAIASAGKEARYLIAVSTGVDSMVLLTAMENMFADSAEKPFAVAHVDHQLREASKEEARFLRQYCADRGISFYESRWETVPDRGVEAAARTFRYAFFAQIMDLHDYPILLTAHHGDDQVETMLMKMMRDGSLSNAFGIRSQQPFGSGVLVRPLLTLTKEEIQRFAAVHQIPSFEDETNLQDIYLRNRIRHQVLPVLKRENAQTVQHFQQLSEEMIYGKQLIDELQHEWVARYVAKHEGQWRMSLKELPPLSEAARYYFFAGLLQQANTDEHAQLKHTQLQQIIRLLDSQKGQWQLDLGGHWVIRRSYDLLYLEQIIAAPQAGPFSMSKEIRLPQGTGVFLSETEWIGYFSSDDVEIPKKITNWSEFSQELPIDYASELLVRKRKPGDRVQLQANLRKKVSRFFIDRKVPNEQREKSWVVTTPKQEIVALLPYVFSYLSIAAETDKIHYILLYKYQE
ncbi:tRNA(Ile)-lysidine synthetase [Enterococcus sp. 8G7_MSG3316]|uniref:tRNA(Ile)-lysidine synthase n=1 Tax=Candidatus Enterococcus testudinis TaxID=1834191 RepID=A0A242A265_9ENTE|nr:tRNA lysidine(34) synthetase TilS [Enterococcus sp. 8G7_MSG3316]OTN75114.1 tRNA(Ile)-lysidine synthetase [Enterococcus sp. 8G7_MSG3316]